MSGGAKYVQAAVAGLVLVVGGALAWRSGRGVPESSVDGRSAAPAAVAPSGPGPSSVHVTGAAVGSIALQWMGVLERSKPGTSSSPAQQELQRSEERECSQEMKKRLAEDPARWNDVLEVLSREDPRIGRNIVGSLKDAVETPGEAVLVRSLREGPHREMRLSAATLIGSRKSNECLWALVKASQEDPDSGVRYKALQELAGRKSPSTSVAEATTIDDVLRQRARQDSDPAVRQFALRMTGQATEAAPGMLPPPKKTAAPATALR
jgi:hypothetical protein